MSKTLQSVASTTYGTYSAICSACNDRFPRVCLLVIFGVLVNVGVAIAQDCPIAYAPAKFPFRDSSSGSSGPTQNRGIMPSGFVAFSDGTPVVHGIDVSKWQSSVDFLKVARCQGRFAYIRLSAGQNPDTELEYRALWSNARFVNLLVGPYHALTLVTRAQGSTQTARRTLDTLKQANVASARKQAQLFMARLNEVLSLDPVESGAHNQLGMPYLPIALGALLDPIANGKESEKASFGEIYSTALCAWFDEVKRDRAFANQPIWLVTTPFIYKDYHLARSTCGLETNPIWISYRTVDGDREFSEKNTGALDAIRSLCGSSPAGSRCVMHQYTALGGFPLQQKWEGLDMDRFYGSEIDLRKLMQRANRN
jgi:hypothetical protein